TNGGETVALLPTRYAGSESSSDPQIRLARKTDWHEAAPGLHVGMGQRMLATDAGEYPLMEIRKIAFDEPSTAPEPAHGSTDPSRAAAALAPRPPHRRRARADAGIARPPGPVAAAAAGSRPAGSCLALQYDESGGRGRPRRGTSRRPVGVEFRD